MNEYGVEDPWVRCDHVSCPNAMADAPAVTWTLIREPPQVMDHEGGHKEEEEEEEEESFTLEPMTAPGLTLAGVSSAAANLEGAARAGGDVILSAAAAASSSAGSSIPRAHSLFTPQLSALTRLFYRSPPIKSTYFPQSGLKLIAKTSIHPNVHAPFDSTLFQKPLTHQRLATPHKLPSVPVHFI